MILIVQRQRWRHKNRDRETEKDTERQTEIRRDGKRQTERQRYRDRDTQRKNQRQRETPRERQRGRDTGIDAERQRQTSRYTETHERYTHIDGDTGRTHMETLVHSDTPPLPHRGPPRPLPGCCPPVPSATQMPGATRPKIRVLGSDPDSLRANALLSRKPVWRTRTWASHLRPTFESWVLHYQL